MYPLTDVFRRIVLLCFSQQGFNLSEVQLNPHTPLPESTRDRMIVLALILITLLAYWPVGRADFINYDDPKYITNNPSIRQGFN